MVEVIEIEYKGKTRRVPKRYVPDTLSEKDKKKQIKSIFENKERPDVKYKKRRSSWAVKFEKKYGTNIKDEPMVQKAIELFEATKITIQSKI